MHLTTKELFMHSINRGQSVRLEEGHCLIKTINAFKPACQLWLPEIHWKKINKNTVTFQALGATGASCIYREDVKGY